MEVLSEILRSLHVSGSVYFSDVIDAPWSKRFADDERASFHLIRSGQCWLVTEDCIERVGPGDLVFAGPGQVHTLTSEHPRRARESFDDSTLLLSGYCEFDHLFRHPLLAALPKLAVVGAEDLLEHGWLRSTLEQLSREYTSQTPGSEVVVDKLTEVLIVELIRVNFGRAEQSGFMRAIYDKRLSAALGLMHESPAKSWTINELARNVGLSRAAFARRFKERIGQTMFEYLTRLRMQKAQDLLRGTRFPMYRVANEVGYESDLAFAKAFKRLNGETPTQFRKRRTILMSEIRC